MIYAAVSVLALLSTTASGKIYFKEDFNDAGWESRWVKSTEWKPEVSCLLLPD
jgi:hypothetical protein